MIPISVVTEVNDNDESVSYIVCVDSMFLIVHQLKKTVTLIWLIKELVKLMNK